LAYLIKLSAIFVQFNFILSMHILAM